MKVQPVFVPHKDIQIQIMFDGKLRKERLKPDRIKCGPCHIEIHLQRFSSGKKNAAASDDFHNTVLLNLFQCPLTARIGNPELTAEFFIGRQFFPGTNLLLGDQPADVLADLLAGRHEMDTPLSYVHKYNNDFSFVKRESKFFPIFLPVGIFVLVL